MISATAARSNAAIAEWRFPNRATPPGSSAYYSIRFAPAALRDVLAALFAWRHELGRIIDDVSDPGVARLKLDWWRDEIRRSIDGTPRHPLSQALAPMLAARDLPLGPFLDQAQQIENALHARRSADQQGLQEALRQDRGALFELIYRSHGSARPSAIVTARVAGGWCEQVRRIRDAGILLRRGRDAVPQELLSTLGFNAEQLASPRHRGQLPTVIAPLADRLRAGPLARTELASLPRALRIQVRIHAALLDELARCGFDVGDQRIGLTPLRKLWIAWGTEA